MGNHLYGLAQEITSALFLLRSKSVSPSRSTSVSPIAVGPYNYQLVDLASGHVAVPAQLDAQIANHPSVTLSTTAETRSSYRS